MKELLLQQAKFNSRFLGVNMDSITEEDALRVPEHGCNNINWILGHILFSRRSIAKMLGEVSEAEIDLSMYARGIAKDGYAGKLLPLAYLQEQLSIYQDKIIKALETAGNMESEFAEKLSFGLSHENYHVGQISILRQAAGKSGAIK